MMEDLEAKVTIWNLKEERNFSFDGVDVREKVEDLKVFYAGSIKAADTVHEDPEAGGVDILIWFL